MFYVLLIILDRNLLVMRGHLHLYNPIISSPPPPSTHCIIDTIALTADPGPLILLQNITCCLSKHNISDISVLQTLSPPLPGVTCYPIRARSLKGPQSGKSTKIILNAHFEDIREYFKCKTGLVFAWHITFRYYLGLVYLNTYYGPLLSFCCWNVRSVTGCGNVMIINSDLACNLNIR